MNPPIELEPWQRRVVDAILSGERIVYVAGRRGGRRAIVAEVERRVATDPISRAKHEHGGER